MVVGQILDCGSRKEKRIKTVKIQILYNTNLELCWPLEVQAANDLCEIKQ